MNALADVFARLDQEKEKLCPELREEVVRGVMAHEAADKPKRPQYSAPIKNYCTLDGAKELQRRCEQFWDRRASYNRDGIKFWIEKKTEKVAAASPTTGRIYCVRSNLINGLPAVRK